MSTSITLDGVTFNPDDFDDYGWLTEITVGGAQYIRILGLFQAGINEIQDLVDEVQASNEAFLWTFDSSTSMADPGTADFRLNHATPASATEIAISCLTADSGNPNIRSILQTWDDYGNSTVRGVLTIRKLGTPTTFRVYQATGSLTDNTTWIQFSLTNLAGSGTFTAADEVAIAFQPAGPAGSDYWNTPIVVTNAMSPYAALDRDVLLCRTGTGAIEIDAPATGRIQVVDVEGQAATYNITFDPPSGDSVMDEAIDESMVIDINWFSATFQRRPSGTNWSVG